MLVRTVGTFLWFGQIVKAYNLSAISLDKENVTNYMTSTYDMKKLKIVAAVIFVKQHNQKLLLFDFFSSVVDFHCSGSK